MKRMMEALPTVLMAIAVAIVPFFTGFSGSDFHVIESLFEGRKFPDLAALYAEAGRSAVFGAGLSDGKIAGLLLAPENALLGPDPLVFHAVTAAIILIYAFCCLSLARRLFPGISAGSLSLCSAVFVFNPFLSILPYEASARPRIMALLLGTFAVERFLAFSAREGWFRLLLSLASFTLASVLDTSFVILPLTMPLLVRTSGTRMRPGHLAASMSPFVLAAALALVVSSGLRDALRFSSIHDVFHLFADAATAGVFPLKVPPGVAFLAWKLAGLGAFFVLVLYLTGVKMGRAAAAAVLCIAGFALLSGTRFSEISSFVLAAPLLAFGFSVAFAAAAAPREGRSSCLGATSVLAVLVIYVFFYTSQSAARLKSDAAIKNAILWMSEAERNGKEKILFFGFPDYETSPPAFGRDGSYLNAAVNWPFSNLDRFPAVNFSPASDLMSDDLSKIEILYWDRPSFSLERIPSLMVEDRCRQLTTSSLLRPDALLLEELNQVSFPSSMPAAGAIFPLEAASNGKDPWLVFRIPAIEAGDIIRIELEIETRSADTYRSEGQIFLGSPAWGGFNEVHSLRFYLIGREAERREYALLPWLNPHLRGDGEVDRIRLDPMSAPGEIRVRDMRIFARKKAGRAE